MHADNVLFSANNVLFYPTYSPIMHYCVIEYVFIYWQGGEPLLYALKMQKIGQNILSLTLKVSLQKFTNGVV